VGIGVRVRSAGNWHLRGLEVGRMSLWEMERKDLVNLESIGD